MQRLVRAVQDLSQARTLDRIMAIVRTAARELTAADGATFVLRDEGQCFYADEDAIGPLWKGQRFPLTACISGWTMLNKRSAVVPDIYRDARVPADAYRPTFVKSLVMVPIRAESPIGAIGTYWAAHHDAADDEVELLQALANSTALALENAQLYADLERRIVERTQQLQAANENLEFANRELDAFTSSVSHDLRDPLNAIIGFSQVLRGDRALSADAASSVAEISHAGLRMQQIIDDLLRFARVASRPLQLERVGVRPLVEGVVRECAHTYGSCDVALGELASVTADEALLRHVFLNLIANAFKFTRRREHPQIEVGSRIDPQETVYFVRDNGAGFDMSQASDLFTPFRRLHSTDDFPGTGVGLSLAHRIVQRHGGRIWANAAVDRGATFSFSIPNR
jgi:signal transduction histidine kinase